ncbi:MAG: hypothetical protein M3014_02350, partial [Chloroflexota bacterium]|nr:hypothetical protein [Chloroflexota bacterium]
DKMAWRRLALSMVPLCAVLALNVGIRLAAYGKIGGYAAVSTDYGSFYWDSLLNAAHVLLAPVNSSQLGQTLAQVVGGLSSLALLTGLILYGREHRRLLTLCGAWLFLTLIPVLNLYINRVNLTGNRYLYLPAAGFCIGVAALAYSALQHGGAHRKVVCAATCTVLALSAILCWVQLAPWHTISVEAAEYHDELLRLIPPPPQPRPAPMTWYVQDQPAFEQGVDVLNLGFGYRRYFIGDGDVPGVVAVENTDTKPLASDGYDAFVMQFLYKSPVQRYDVVNLSGITGDSPPPTSNEAGDNLRVWDFRKCMGPAIAQWQPYMAQPSCAVDKGLRVRPMSDDAHLLNPTFSSATVKTGARFLRIRASVQYPAITKRTGLLSQWYWKGMGSEWSEAHSRSIYVRGDGMAHVYWTFVPIEDIQPDIEALRFDPLNAKAEADIHWISVDLVK